MRRPLQDLPSAIIAFVGSGSLIYQWYWTRPLWLDEEMIALNFRDRSITELAGPLWLNQAAPLGWLWVQRVLLLEFGSGERAIRAFPVLLGVATLWLAFWAGRRWMGGLGAAVLTLLCSFGLFLSFFPLESKHYSGDTFFGLLLPVLVVWALEPLGGRRDVPWKRLIAWWIVVATAQWLANGALFAAPACAAVILTVVARRAGWRNALLAVLPGLLVVASFAVHYRLAMRHAMNSPSLQEYWWHAFPPQGAGVVDTMRWLGSRLPLLAVNPGGTQLRIAFWIAAIAGMVLAFRTRATLGLALAAVPLSAFVFAGLRLVPMEERLTLWALPALYMGIAIAADQLRPRPSLAIASALVALVVTADITRAGVYELSVRPSSNHNLDDRTGLRFLMAQRQAGDVLVSGRLGLPAVWWYGGVNVAPPNLGATFQADGSPVLEARHHAPGPECRASDLLSSLDGRTRVAVYLGFDSRNPAGLQELVFDTLASRGRMTVYRRIAEDAVAAIFDLREPPQPWSVVLTRPTGTALKEIRRPAGCVGFFPAVRW